MKAVLLTEHGSVEKLQWVEECPTPEPGPDEARVRVYASSLNRLDLFVRQGWPGLNLSLPHILGADAAGVIDALGESVAGWAVGDRVAVDPTISCGLCGPCLSGRHNLCAHFGILGEDARGTNAEFVVVPARNLVRLPEHVGYAEAAAAGLVYLTAWHSLITRGELRAGESVLVVGAGGGVNTASIQIAKFAGAKVYVVGSSDEKLEQARDLGADVLINRAKEDWSNAIYRFTDRQGVDVVVDNVGQATLFGSIRAVRKGGRILIVGNTSGPQFDLDLRYIFSKQISLIGSTMAPHSDYITVMNLIFAGKIKPVIGARLPLEEIREAHQMLERGDVFGKIVLLS